MNVLLVDRSGQARVKDIPDDLAEYRVPLPTDCRRWLRWDGPGSLEQPITVTFRPTGHWRCRLSPTGVSAWPVWQQQA